MCVLTVLVCSIVTTFSSKSKFIKKSLQYIWTGKNWIINMSMARYTHNFKIFVLLLFENKRIEKMTSFLVLTKSNVCLLLVWFPWMAYALFILSSHKKKKWSLTYSNTELALKAVPEECICILLSCNTWTPCHTTVPSMLQLSLLPTDIRIHKKMLLLYF